MERDLIARKKSDVVMKYGEWTAHNIKLTEGLYTIGERIVGDEVKLRRILQIVSDAACMPLKDLRVLDLACLEGLYAIELARHGARVVAIEGREANIEKARFVKEALSLDTLELFQDDVRNLNKEVYGQFDVVLCLGILYHLDVPDVFLFMKKIAEVCQGIAIIDTHVSLAAKQFHIYEGKKYWGGPYAEHSISSSPEEREKSLWASLDNVTSFWLTRPSLYNLLEHVGFTSAYECQNPAESIKPRDRCTLLAMRGRRQTLISTPLANALPEDTLFHAEDPSGPQNG